MKRLLSESESLRDEQKEIAEIREGLFNFSVSGFKSEFEDEIIEKINSSKYSKKIYFEQLEYSFKKVAFAVMVIIVLALGYNIERYGSIGFSGNSWNRKSKNG